MQKTKRILACALALAGLVSMLFFVACPNEDTGPDKFSIKKGAHENGDFDISPTSAKKGDTITLTPYPDSGFTLKEFTTTPAVDITKDGDSYTFIMPAKKVTVTAEFEALPPGFFTVKKGEHENGDFTINPTSAKEGATITLNPKPVSDEFYFERWVCEPESVSPAESTGGNWTFTMPDEDVTVNAIFKPDTTPRHLVTKGTMTNGDFSFTASSINEQGIREGSTVTLTPEPELGYEIDTWESSPTVTFTEATGGKFTFTMPEAAIEVTAKFKAKVYTVNPGTNANGKIEVDPAEGTVGTVITISAEPNENYGFSAWAITPNTVIPTEEAGVWTFVMPASNVTVNATFGQLFTITKGTIDGGDITISSEKAAMGATITITLVPDTLYVELWEMSPLDTIPVAGAEPGTWTFKMPGTNVVVGGKLSVTEVKPAVVLENWVFPAGQSWVEHYNANYDVVYWKWRNPGPATIYGEYEDTNGVKMLGMSFTSNEGTDNSFGCRYYWGQGTLSKTIDHPRLFDISGYTHISIWVKVSQAPTTLRYLMDNGSESDPTIERRFAMNMTVPTANEWTELLLPIYPVSGWVLSGYTFDPKIVGGWMIAQNGFPLGATFWIGPIKAVNTD